MIWNNAALKFKKDLCTVTAPNILKHSQSWRPNEWAKLEHLICTSPKARAVVSQCKNCDTFHGKLKLKVAHTNHFCLILSFDIGLLHKVTLKEKQWCIRVSQKVPLISHRFPIGGNRFTTSLVTLNHSWNRYLSSKQLKQYTLTIILMLFIKQWN